MHSLGTMGCYSSLLPHSDPTVNLSGPDPTLTEVLDLNCTQVHVKLLTVQHYSELVPNGHLQRANVAS